MTRKEAERQTRQVDTLMSLGFTRDEVEQLRRISMTLHRWHEHECNGDIERDEATGKTFWTAHIHALGHTNRYPTPDRETGARKRLAAIVARRNARVTHPDSPEAERNIHATCAARTCPHAVLTAYIQTDPRGAALYILRPGDVPEGGDPSGYYNRGICVY